MAKRKILTQYNSVFLILLVVCLCAFLYKPSFFGFDNVNLILRQASALGILVMGQIFVISCGCIDLSVVSIMQISIAVFMMVTKSYGENMLFAGILLAIIAGVGIGLLNGVIVARWKVQPFLSTLFMAAILGGVREVFSGVTPLGVPPQILMTIVKGGRTISYCILWFAVAALIAYVVLSKTVYGAHVMMVGTNKTAALFSGIRVNRVIVTAYCISGLSAVLAAVVATGYLGFADQTSIGSGMEMNALVAAVLGGNFLSGGRASVSGAVGGVLTLTLIINIVILFGLPVQYQYVLKGLILLAVVYMAARSQNSARRSCGKKLQPVDH